MQRDVMKKIQNLGHRNHGPRPARCCTLLIPVFSATFFPKLAISEGATENSLQGDQWGGGGGWKLRQAFSSNVQLFHYLIDVGLYSLKKYGFLKINFTKSKKEWENVELILITPKRKPCKYANPQDY